MSLFKRIIASVLVVLTILGSIPLEGINIAQASPISVGESGSFRGNYSNLNPQGNGVKKAGPSGSAVYRAGFRVSIKRNPDMYMDGTPESKQKVISEYRTKYPIIDTFNESMIFSPHDLQDGYNNGTIGLILYNRSSHNLDWFHNSRTNQIVARMTGTSSTSVSNGHTLNKAKIAIQNAGYLTADGKGKLLSELKDGKWREFANAISYDDAMRIWNHVFHYNNGYDVTGRLDKVISQYVSQGINLRELPTGQKHDIIAGYIGVLISLYKISESKSLYSFQATVSKAIEDYVSSSDITNKPVSIVIDTAVPVVEMTEYGRKQFYVPSIDFMEIVGLVPSHASIVASEGSAVKSGLLSSGNTKSQLLEGAVEGLKLWPIEETRYGNGMYRVGDAVTRQLVPNATDYQVSLYYSGLGYGAVVPGFAYNRLRTYNGSAHWGSSKVNAGFIDMITFDGNIKGFTITSLNLIEEEIDAEYKVDTSLRYLDRIDEATLKVVEENKITFTVNANSPVISIVEAQQKSGNGDPKLEITGKVFRERYVQDALDEAKKEIPELSSIISGTFTGTELINKLQGQEQMLIDTSVLNDTFESREDEFITVKYVYYIEDLKIKLNNFEKDYTWEDIVVRIEDVPQNFVEHIGDATISITKDYDGGDIDKENWKPSTMVNQYTYSTTGTEQYAEIKNNKIGNEKYEVMAGVPSTEEIYFSAGGTEFMLSVVYQYWVQESGVERTYRSYYSGTSCEYKEADNAGTGSIGGYSVDLHNGGTYTKTWTGTIPNLGETVTVNGSGDVEAVSTAVPDRSEYDAAMEEALAYIEEVNNTTLDHTAGSDGFTRSQTGWSAHISTDAPIDPVDVVATDSQWHEECSTDSEGNETCVDVPDPASATAEKSPDGNFTIVVTFIVPAHIICGPCCTHELPGIEDTWRQGIYYDYAKISQLRLYKIDQGAVTGEKLKELTGMEEIFASIKQGNPTYFMNIAQLSMKSPAPVDLRGGQIGYDDIEIHNNTIYSGSPRTSYLLNIGNEAIPSESSKFGRLRYSLEPTQHDTVVWNEGVRTNKCDGLAPTKNDSATVSKPVAGNGHGDDQPWAVGCLYTNSSYPNEYDFHMQKDGLRNKSAYSDKADDRDIATEEWKKFDERRRSKNIATVISDFLILQTSGGDQSIFYFQKESEEKEAQDYFPYVRATEEEMFTNNPYSIFKAAEEGESQLKDEEFRINIGGYNGDFKNPSKKHEPVDGKSHSVLQVNGTKVPTIFDNDPAKTITRPKREGKMLLYQDGIKIKPTAPNKVYSFDDAAVFYKQMVGYFSMDVNRQNAQGSPVKIISNVALGIEARTKIAENFAKWGDKTGLPFTTRYTRDINDKINSIIVFSPVSTENATILPLNETSPLIINGEQISRDQRIDKDKIPDLNEQISRLMVCPLDPGLCEFRTLNCKFSEDNLLAEFDFESTYVTQERKTIGGKVEIVDVEKPNTYKSGSNWITTNKVTGIEYVLPSGFTIGSSGKVGTGGYLEAKGTRWSIPFSDLGITNDKNNVISVKMDFYMDPGATLPSMIVSFYRYDFYLYTHNSSNNYNGLFNTGNGTSGAKGAGLVDKNFKGQKMTLELDFSFNNIMDSKAKINGVPVTVKVQSSQPVWDTVGGIRQQVVKTVALDRSTPDTLADTMPDNLTSDYIGSTINIGSWGASGSYPADFYIDNLEIWLKGGTHEHNSTCYTNMVIHETKKIHVHDENCYTKGDTYSSCTGVLNSNYQLGCGKTTTTVENCTGVLNSGGSAKTYYIFNHGSGCSYRGYTHYSTNSSTCSVCSHSCNRPSSGTTLSAGKAIWYHNDRYADSHISTSTSYCTQCGSSSGTVTLSAAHTRHTHTSSCYHKHTGTAGTDSANGCYTKATAHKHTSACGYVPANTLQCTGELNTESDYNVHIHTPECLTTQTILPTQKYNYTGDVQIFDVPATGTYTIKAWGASGGGTQDRNQGSAAGYGGYVEGKIHLRKGERLYIYVGGEGKRATSLNTGGGWNGGGHGGPNGYGGGGATDIRTYRGSSWDDTRSLLSRIMVAGGGGGADNTGGTLGGTEDGRGGNGGNLVGENAKINGVYSANTGAKQNSGNALGKGGSATVSTDTGGGGGGYYGGKATNNSNGGGGGGSSYISGHSGVNSIEFDLSENGVITNIRHNNSRNHYTGKVFTNTKMESGKQIGHGRVEIIPDNITMPNLLDQIAEGELSASEMEKYLGKELMSKLWGNDKLMFTWSNWSSSNMKGFNQTTYGLGSSISAVSGNLRIIQNSSNYELKVPVDIPSSIISRIELVIDNNTSATSGRISASSGIGSYPTSSSGTNFTMKANTTNQTIEVKPNYNWIENIGALWFDIGSGAKYNGDIVVKAIRLYGYGEAIPGTGEVQTVTIKTPEQTTESTKVPKYVKVTKTTRYTNDVPGTPTTKEEEVSSMGTPTTYDNVISERTKVVSSGETWDYTTVGVHSRVFKAGKYRLEAWGAQGNTNSYADVGGNGGKAQGEITLTSDTTLNIYVGGQNGWNGGGAGGTGANSGANGGGASDIRIGGTALSNRVIVAGGGGGGGAYSNGGSPSNRSNAKGGSGGAAHGNSGSKHSHTGAGTGGAAATTFSGGSGGAGGSAGSSSNTDGAYYQAGGGGGGGGYYGGGGGGSGAMWGGTTGSVNGKAGSSGSLGSGGKGGNASYTSSPQAYWSYPGGGGGAGSSWTGSLSAASTTANQKSGNGRVLITSLQDIYSGNDVYDRIEISYYETTKTVSTPKTVVKETTQTSFDPLKIVYVASENVYDIPGSYTFTAPSTGKYSFEAWGANGGFINGNVSGKGGYTYGEIHLNKGETIYVYVGERGTGNSQDFPVYTYNGGGYAGLSHAHLGGRGGGATDFRLSSGTWDNLTGLRSRIMVAGGGGGSGCASNLLIHGDAGGLVGSDTLNGGTTYYGYVAKGGTQTGGLVGHRNGNSVSVSYSKAGEFGKGAKDAQCAAGGGGGYYGGGSTYTAGGAGGSSFISGHAGANAVNSNGTHRGNPNHYSGKVFTNTIMKAGNEVMPRPNGGTEVGHTGNGYARIRLIPDKPQGSAIKTTILANIDLIPELLADGSPNPIFLCKGLPYNAHVCTDNCRTVTILNCTEPHHYGEHYDSSSRVCWEACEDDHNHRIAPLEVEVEPGRYVRNADFLQLDEEFTVFFPNRGNFGGNNALGLKTLQSQTGKGYSNNMNTTLWTREKRVKFGFDVLYDNGTGVHLYKAGMWIELPVEEEYFDFYIPVAVREAANATVEFEVEAINNGVEENPLLSFPETITTTYKNALTNFRRVLEPRWIQAVSSGYVDHKSSVYGYDGYYSFKKSEENKLNNAVATTKNIITINFPKINEKAKPLTSNDNRIMVSNRKRSSSLEHLHGGYKKFFVDLVGRIGNFAIVDTEDFRFSNFFKLPLTDPPEWFIKGFIYKVDESIQNKYLGDLYDIRGNRVSADTKWLNTYGTQPWMQGTIESDRDVNSPNLVPSILSDTINNIPQLKGEQLRYGYDIYTTISTFGNYQGGKVLVTPYYYALNLRTGEMKPIDVYISKDGIYEPVNIFGNSINGVAIDKVYDYVLNLDWSKESERRNYTLAEKTATEKYAEYKKQIIYDYSGVPEEGDGIPEGYELPIIGEKAYEVPSGAYNYMGTAQSLLLTSKHRTFIGSEYTSSYPNEISKWGYNKNPGEILHPMDFIGAVQRWHFKIGIPSSSVFVIHGADPIQEEIEKIMNPDYAIISTASIIAQGDLWTLEYTQPWLSAITINGNTYNIGDEIPPIIAVYSSEDSSILDIDIIKTH